MASGSMLKYINTNNSINIIVEDENETDLIEISEENITEKKRLIYNYFTKISKDQSKCNFCNKNLKTPNSTTTTMTRHLKTQHLTLYTNYQKESQINVKNNQKRKREDTLQQQNIIKSMSKSEKLPADSKKARLITEKNVEMIALDYQPITIVEDKGFKRVMAAAEDRYVLPSRKILSQKLIPESMRA